MRASGYTTQTALCSPATLSRKRMLYSTDQEHVCGSRSEGQFISTREEQGQFKAKTQMANLELEQAAGGWEDGWSCPALGLALSGLVRKL